MASLTPGGPMRNMPNDLPENGFKRRGIRMHGVSAKAIGAQTPAQQNEQAQQIARITDPVVGPAVPQDRIARYGPDMGA